MKKKILVPIILLVGIIIITVIYINDNYKTISEIGGFQINDITKISFQYDNPANKGGDMENKEKVNEFMKYINSCIFTKKLIQTPVSGYYQMAVFYTGDKEVMRIMTYNKFIEINGIQYNMVKNKLSLEKIDNFIKSITNTQLNVILHFILKSFFSRSSKLYLCC